MMRLCFMFVFFHGVVGEVELLNNNGENVTLHTGINKTHNDVMLWYFNDILIAMINRDNITSRLYDGKDGIFRERLEVDYKTGSLTIKDVKTEHTGRFEADFISDDSGKSQSLNNKNAKTKHNKSAIIRKSSPRGKIIKTFIVTISDTNMEARKEDEQVFENELGLSSGTLAGICTVLFVAVLLVILAVVRSKNYQRQKTNNRKRVMEKKTAEGFCKMMRKKSVQRTTVPSENSVSSVLSA